MAELPGEGKFHDVSNSEADAIFEDSTHMIMHNEALGRIIRNMYTRIKALEIEVSNQKLPTETKAEKPAKRSGSA